MRTNVVDGGKPAGPVMQTDSTFQIDLERYQIQNGRRRESLTRLEREILALFMRSDRRTLSRDEILNSVWGPHTQVDNSSVDNIVARIRSKFRSLQMEEDWIQTVRGKGYRWIGAPSPVARSTSA